MYKLSPSDFAYLYEECKLCYYLKIKQGIVRPFSPFPGVFAALNTRLQGALMGKNLRELSSVLPDGIVESQEGHVQSKQIPNTNVYIRGKYDLLVRLPDNSYLIVDFKISKPDEEKIAKYQTQLQSYHYAFENPAWGEPKNITKLGLIIMYPDKTRFENGLAVMDFPPKWLEIDIKKDSFMNFVSVVSNLLEGPTPKETADCKWCQYRHLGETLTHQRTSDIPF